MQKKREVYLVDDEQLIIEGFEANLADDFDVKCFNSAKDALNSMEGSAEPDVIVSDLRMPEIDGFKFIEMLRAKNKNSKIIISSGHAKKQDVLKAVDLGVFAVLEKPFTSDQLLKTVNRAAESFKDDYQDLCIQELLKLNSYFSQLNDVLFNRIVLLEDSAIHRQIKFIQGYQEIKKYQAGLQRERQLDNLIAELKEEIEEKLLSRKQGRHV